MVGGENIAENQLPTATGAYPGSPAGKLWCSTAALSKIWDYLSDCSEAEIDGMCRALGLEEVVKSNAGDLGRENLNTVSGGERQRESVSEEACCARSICF